MEKEYKVKVWIAEDSNGNIRAFTKKPTLFTHKLKSWGFSWALNGGDGNAEGNSIPLNNGCVYHPRIKHENNEIEQLTFLDDMGIPKKSFNACNPMYEGISKKEPVLAEISLRFLPTEYQYDIEKEIRKSKPTAPKKIELKPIEIREEKVEELNLF